MGPPGPPGHPAQLSDDDLLPQCKFRTGRSSGPGGQHRNKVETAVTVRHMPTGVSAQASERRSQVENKRVALRRLRLAMAVGCRESVDASAVRPSVLWESRRKGSKIVCNPTHRDYAALLAEALDAIAACQWEGKAAALLLGVSATQLLKLVQDHQNALRMWNEHRTALGKHSMRRA